MLGVCKVDGCETAVCEADVCETYVCEVNDESVKKHGLTLSMVTRVFLNPIYNMNTLSSRLNILNGSSYSSSRDFTNPSFLKKTCVQKFFFLSDWTLKLVEFCSLYILIRFDMQ